jgi:hypothetical protein
MADWPTIASLATAGGTLVLAAATFASVRSANRAARTAERSLLAGLRPLFLNSRLQDAEQKVWWQDEHVNRLGGGRAIAEEAGGVIYMLASLRNAGSGIGVVHGWIVYPEWRPGDQAHADLDRFRRQNRDLYIAPGDTGFWQGAIRDMDDPDRPAVLDAIRRHERLTLDLLYGDYEGGQRTITRFSFTPIGDGFEYLCGVGRHWNIDRADPR